MHRLEINGRTQSLAAPDDMPLLWALRDRLGLTGTKYGCGIAMCGACTVHIDGQPSRSCAITIAAATGRRITTIEGLSGRVGEAVLAAWIDLDVAQCGYCQPGQIMSAVGLLQVVRSPTDADIEAAMTGNVCRCATYVRIKAAIKAAAAKLAA